MATSSMRGSSSGTSFVQSRELPGRIRLSRPCEAAAGPNTTRVESMPKSKCRSNDTASVFFMTSRWPQRVKSTRRRRKVATNPQAQMTPQKAVVAHHSAWCMCSQRSAAKGFSPSIDSARTGIVGKVAGMGLLDLRLRGQRVLVDLRLLTDRQDVHDRLITSLPVSANQHSLVSEPGMRVRKHIFETFDRDRLLVDDHAAVGIDVYDDLARWSRERLSVAYTGQLDVHLPFVLHESRPDHEEDEQIENDVHHRRHVQIRLFERLDFERHKDLETIRRLPTGRRPWAQEFFRAEVPIVLGRGAIRGRSLDCRPSAEIRLTTFWASESISITRPSTRPAKYMYSTSAGMATIKPPAVAIRAMPMPRESSSATLTVPTLAAMPLKLLIIPCTVPSRPSSGETVAMVFRILRFLRNCPTCRSPPSMIACSTSTLGLPHLRTPCAKTWAIGLPFCSHRARAVVRSSCPASRCSRKRLTKSLGITRRRRRTTCRSTENATTITEHRAIGYISGPPASNISDRRTGIFARSRPAGFASGAVSAIRDGSANVAPGNSASDSSWSAAGSVAAQAAMSPASNRLLPNSVAL